ncbi:MAG: hypothetical protein VR68_08295 [Peptococcaceae bacterium BRH_c4a]|nr:MAG: hypothetical protein VR68_08295 [Peptococcaceae bacterium BRH_c4a]
MGRRRETLPPVPLFMLSKQQRKVYDLAFNYGTREISSMLSISEKQVRQVYSVIRGKSREFINKYVPLMTGDKSALLYHNGETAACCDDFFRELMVNHQEDLSASELFVLEHVKKGISIGEISGLTGKSVIAIRKTHQRAKRKIIKKNIFFDDNCITKIDTEKTPVGINFIIISEAMELMQITNARLSKDTGISVERLEEIERERQLYYNELFSLIKYLRINPYGPTERDLLLKKVNDVSWINMIREGETGEGYVKNTEGKRKHREKAVFRNRVIYYGTACYHYNCHNRNRPIIEDGRNGLFPLTLTREQQSQCRWLLKRLMLKPVYTYRYPGLEKEIERLEKMIAHQQEDVIRGRRSREIQYLRQDILPENGRSIFLVSKYQMKVISQVLYGH